MEKGATGVGDAVSEELLVGVDVVAVFAREDLRHRDGDDEAEDGDDDGVAEVVGGADEARHGGSGEAARDLAYDAHPVPLVEVAEVGGEDSESDGDQLCGDGRLQTVGVALVDDLLHDDQHRAANDGNDDVGDVDTREVLRHLDGDQRDFADAADGPDLEAEQAGHLACRDVEAGAGQEATDERRRHEGGEHTETEHAHQDLHDADDQRDGTSHTHLHRYEVEIRVHRAIAGWRSELESARRPVDTRAHQQTWHGHRAPRDVARCAEHEVEQYREKRAVEAVHRGNLRQQREAESLGDVDDADADSRNDISQQVLAHFVRRQHRHEREKLEQRGRRAAISRQARALDRLAELEAALLLPRVAASPLVVGRREGLPTDLHHRRPIRRLGLHRLASRHVFCTDSQARVILGSLELKHRATCHIRSLRYRQVRVTINPSEACPTHPYFVYREVCGDNDSCHPI